MQFQNKKNNEVTDQENTNSQKRPRSFNQAILYLDSSFPPYILSQFALIIIVICCQTDLAPPETRAASALCGVTESAM